MPSVSFRLRRDDDIGSLVRQVSRDDSAIRSDSYVQPVANSAFSTFTVSVTDGQFINIVDANRINGYYTAYQSTVDLSFTLDQPLQSNPSGTSLPIGVVIVVSSEGEPLTVEDGKKVYECNATNYNEHYLHISTDYTENTWLYYSMFVKYSNGTTTWYERVADTSVLLPTLYFSVNNLWDKIPPYYRSLDNTQASGSLYRFVSLFGWELDKTRSLIDSLMLVNDPMIAPPSALEQLAKQVGLEISINDLGTKKVRAILNNIFELRKRKGTSYGTSAFISAMSGSKVEYIIGTNTFKIFTHRVNLVSDPKFKNTTTTTVAGSPATISRTPFTLRGTSDGSSLRNTARTDLAIRGETTNSSGYLNYAYTTNQYISTAASVGWGVYTYGPNMSGSGSVPVVEHVQYYGTNLNGGSVPVVGSGGNGLKISIPATANGAQNVVVYGRRPFRYAEGVQYYTSFNSVLSGASFSNLRFIKYSNVGTYLEVTTPDALGNALYFDQWNDVNASTANHFMVSPDTYYSNSEPSLSTYGRFAVEHPLHDYTTFESAYVVPVLTFTINPGGYAVVSNWLVEPNGLGVYFDGDTETGGFVRQANQTSPIGISDYRWGANGGSTNVDFSYYTLDYARVVDTVTRVVENNLMPVDMIGNYTLAWNKIPGE